MGKTKPRCGRDEGQVDTDRSRPNEQERRPATFPSRLLTQEQVAERWGFAVKTLERWRAEGRGPKFARFSKRMVRYRETDIEAFIKNCEVAPEAMARW